MPRTPKLFQPKAGEPGSRIEYTVWQAGNELTRTGIVWADGPLASSRWVQPDHDPTNQVLVRVRRGKPAEQVPHSDGEAQRQTIRLFERIQAAGTVFAVREDREPTTRRPHNLYDLRSGLALSWHIDPQCPAVAGKERYTEQYGTYSASTVLAGMMDRPGGVTVRPLCRACVYQDLIQHFSYDWPPFGRKHVWWDRDHVRTAYEGATAESLSIHNTAIKALERVDEMARQERRQRTSFRIEDGPAPAWLSEQVSGVAA